MLSGRLMDEWKHDGSRRRCTRQRSMASLEHSYGPKEFLAFSILSVLSSPSQSMLLFSRPGLLCLDLEWVISPFGYVTMSHFERLAIPPHQLLRTSAKAKALAVLSFICLLHVLYLIHRIRLRFYLFILQLPHPIQQPLPEPTLLLKTLDMAKRKGRRQVSPTRERRIEEVKVIQSPSLETFY